VPISFSDLIADARRAVVGVDRFTKRDGAKETAAAINKARYFYGKLLEHQFTASMTQAEASALQEVVDLLKARLKFFGEPV
jgi:hypothetical protein